MKGIFTLLSKWDYRYLDLAEHIATWSKDPSRQIGAVAIGNKGQVLAQGYNGFPRNIIDSNERYTDREKKYKLVVHAEMNCIYNAGFNGVSLDGSTIYVTGLPTCSNCALGVIQVGVKRVVMRADVDERWRDSWSLTKQLFQEAGVKYELIAKTEKSHE
jgi:dCMP deaminase